MVNNGNEYGTLLPTPPLKPLSTILPSILVLLVSVWLVWAQQPELVSVLNRLLCFFFAPPLRTWQPQGSSSFWSSLADPNTAAAVETKGKRETLMRDCNLRVRGY